MLFNKKKKLESIRKQWGKPVDRFRNMDLISIYHKIYSEKHELNYVDDKTWSDLNFDSIFASMDRNTSNIGQQYLYHLLHKYEPDTSVLKQRFELVETLKNNAGLREESQLHLSRLSETNTYFIPNVVLSESLPFTKHYYWFYIFGYLPMALIILTIFNGVFLFFTLGALLINIIINQIFSRRIYEYFSGFAGLNTLIISAKLLARIKTETPIDEFKVLHSHYGLLRILGKKFRYLVIDKESMNELIGAGVEYGNMLFLYDTIAYYRSVALLRKHQAQMEEVYNAVAHIDVCISVASYIQELPYFTNPFFTVKEQISFEDLYHPLIENPVSNTLNDLSKSVLITGSNMSGKTTFIKTVGINFILAQTLYIALSKKFISPKHFVKSAINRMEDLEHKKSYFFVEVEELQEFMELSQNGAGYLFLIDEIFRGTNTIERLAASTAVLRELSKRCFVFVTTHDIELQEMLQNSFEMIHFSEQVNDHEYFFDYKIRKGPCSSGNAIKLLEIKNYPENVVKEANGIVKKLIGNSNRNGNN